MDGYINEGGQLKTKNGQKYIVNERSRNGFYITKSGLILAAISAIIAIVATILITFFLSTYGAESCLNGKFHKYETDEPLLNKAGIFEVNSKNDKGDTSPTDSTLWTEHTELSTISTTTTLLPNLVVNQKLEFYEGWNPQHYRLLIEPNLESMTNNGSVTIQLARDLLFDEMKSIVLDINNITIHDVNATLSNKIKNEDNLEIDHYYGQNNKSYIIFIKSSGPIDNVFIHLSFTSQITDTLQGIYKTSYMDVTSMRPQWMISTQFSPIDARRAFPCIDRPDKKANFTISIVRDKKKYMALSNMPTLKTKLVREGFVRDDFQTTPRMPTYLVAFIVSDLIKSNVTDNDLIKSPVVNIWTRPETTGMTKYAHKLTRKVLPFFENYFDMKYQLPKIDLVSIPDFGFGAMENWGLITFRDSSLLVPDEEEKMSSAQHTEFVASIICHEISHQWFGNLVTPKNWEDLWLKEGFASYLSFLAIDNIYPQWRVLDTFTIYEFQQSMEKDSDDSSHPITFPIINTFDIRRMFDPITYSKGPILMRMIQSMVGTQAFQMGLQEYLKINAYGNLDRDELWEILTKYGHKYGTLPKELTLGKIISTWVYQPGYPMVTLKRDKRDVIVTQERFLVSNKNKTDSFKWYIPITLETSDMKRLDDNHNFWLTDDKTELRIENVFPSDYNKNLTIHLNLNRQGYYRVNYDYNSWIALNKDFALLDHVTRAQIIDDALHLARAEYLTYDIPITFLLELRKSPEDELLWMASEQGLKYLINMLQREPAYELFRAFMRYIVLPAFNHYGLEEPEGESHLALAHRARVASLACKFNYDRCTNTAQRKFRDWIENPFTEEIKPNLKETIYCTAIAEGSFQEWYFAYDQYKKTLSASEKEMILSSMGCTSKPWLLSKYLNMTLDPLSGILKQDAARAFSSVANNPLGFEIAFDFLSTNIKEISEYFGDGFQTVSKMVASITTYMTKDYHKKQLQIFSDRAKELELNSVVNAVFLAMQTVDNNIYWRQRSYNSIRGVLQNFVDDFQINIY
ncbi:hypothetical protein ACFFRR_005619 [Megaselia abdita]